MAITREATAVQSEAADKVFGTYELVALILENLDELSLVRVQGVNSMFRAVFHGMPALRRRLGLQDTVKPDGVDAAKSVIGVEAPRPESAPVEWANLLNWFSFPIQKLARDDGEPLRDAKLTARFQLLPHAYRAAMNPNALVHHLCATSPPVNRIILLRINEPISARRYSRRIVNNERGVTIGQVLTAWIALGKSNLGLPVATYIPWGFPAQMPGLYLKFVDEIGVAAVKSLMSQVVHNLPHSQEFQKTLQGRYKARKKVKAQASLIYEWYYITNIHAEEWFMVTRVEQQKRVVEQLRMRKRCAVQHGWPGDFKYPAWPALALTEENENGEVDEKEVPYQVDFAAGVVFNRQRA